MIKTDTNSENTLLNSGINIALSIGKGYLLSLFLLFLLAVLITYTSLSESYENSIITVITVAGIIFASASSALNKRTRGWLHGAITGFIYTFLIYAVSVSFLSGFREGKSALLSILIGVLCGMLGGIIGINLKKK